MNYKVIIRAAAEKFILQMNEPDYRAVVGRLRLLAREPRPLGAKKLSVAALWRLRVRKFRIIYSIDDDKRVVAVLRVARRSEGTYKGL